MHALVGRYDDPFYLTLPTPQGHNTFPGGPVRHGEGIEDAVRRLLHDQLGVAVEEVDFRAVVEHTTPSGGSELWFVFEVHLSNHDAQTASTAPGACWADDTDLRVLDVQPGRLRDAVADGTLADRVWMPAPPR